MQHLVPIIVGLTMASGVLLPAHGLLASSIKSAQKNGVQETASQKRSRRSVCEKCGSKLDNLSKEPKRDYAFYAYLCTSCANDYVGLRKYFTREGFFAA